MSPKDKVYYTKILMAVVFAAICAYFNITETLGFMVGLAGAFVAHVISLYVLSVSPEVFDGSQSKMFLNGFFSYLLLFIVLWALFYDILYLPW
ncbi:MAG: hypothetical protein ACP6IU_07155 [Candidatus Asgardarchaeia archaeon]